MRTLEIRVDSRKGRLQVKGTPFAGSKVEVSFSHYASDTAQIGLYVFDRRVYEEPNVAPRVRVFPPPGLKCVAMSEREGGTLVLDLNTQEILDQFSDGKRQPGSVVSAMVYLWDPATPEVVATGLVNVEWSPVYFTPDHTPVTMKGDPGEKGDPGNDGEDAIVGPLTPGQIVNVDASGKHLEDAGRNVQWLHDRVTAYRNASGTLVFTTGNRP